MHSKGTVIIAVMGATGSGKSTFVNLASGSTLATSSRLESCTSEVQTSRPFFLEGREITLIDTPGFDDTEKSEADILNIIADYLVERYEQGTKVNGVIFLHRITDNRIGGVARKNFRLFRKLCGDDTLEHVQIVTNMWSSVEREVGEEREHSLATSDRFFKPALDKGARFVRHDNTRHSAHAIIRQLVGLPPVALQLQREMVDEHKRLSDTDAGAIIHGELKQEVEKHVMEMQGMKSDLEELLQAKDQDHKEEIEELTSALAEMRMKLEKNVGDILKLQAERDEERRRYEKSVDHLAADVESRDAALRSSYEERIRTMREESRIREAGYKDELQKLERELSMFRKAEDLARKRKQEQILREEKERSEREERLRRLREEMLGGERKVSEKSGGKNQAQTGATTGSKSNGDLRDGGNPFVKVITGLLLSGVACALLL